MRCFQVFIARWVSVFAVCLFLWPQGPVAATTGTCDTVRANGVDFWFPFIYRTPGGDLTGVVVDGAREALSRLGIKLVVGVSTPWKRIIKDMEDGHIDMVLGGYWNAKRAAKYHYAGPLGKEEIRVFVKAGQEFPLSSFEDLKGRPGVRLLGGSLGQKFDAYADRHLEFQVVRTNEVVVDLLRNDRADYGILGYVQGQKFIEAKGLVGDVVDLPWTLLNNDVFVMVSRQSACAGIVEKLNAVIKEMQKEGYSDQLFLKHSKLPWVNR